MNSNLVIAAVAFLIFAVGGTYLYTHQTDSEEAPPQTAEPQTNPNEMEIKIALLDTNGNGPGKKLGCDAVNMVTRTIPRTEAPLTAALQQVFSEPEGAQPSTNYNFLARTRETLKFDRAEVKDGTAHIYLTGELSGLAGICDDPRAEIQIEETALQFPTVQNVVIYLNGVAGALTPARQGS